MNECWRQRGLPELWRRFKDECTGKHCLFNYVTDELWASSGVWLSTFDRLVHRPFKMCPYRTNWLLGLQDCCLQLSQEPVIWTTSHSPLHFLGSWTIDPASAKSNGWDNDTYTDSCHFSEINVFKIISGPRCVASGMLVLSPAPLSSVVAARSFLENRPSKPLHTRSVWNQLDEQYLR